MDRVAYRDVHIGHYILDWTYDEDRCRIRTQYGPENISRLRRLAICTIKSVSNKGVTETTKMLAMNVRLVFDYLKMTRNSRGARTLDVEQISGCLGGKKF
jgi:hypothetical protein